MRRVNIVVTWSWQSSGHPAGQAEASVDTLMFSREDVIRTFLTVSPTSHYTEPWEWPKVTTALPSSGRCWDEPFPGSYSRCPHSRWGGSRRGSRSSCYLCGVELIWPRLCSKTEGPWTKPGGTESAFTSLGPVSLPTEQGFWLRDSFPDFWCIQKSASGSSLVL